MDVNSKIPRVSIQLVVRNGEYYIRECLGHVFSQTYPNIEVFVFDNDSQDKTVEIVKNEFPKAEIIRSSRNYGLGGGQNRCFEISRGEYVVFHCVDVLLDKDFVTEGIKAMLENPEVGALQAKILQYNKKGFQKTNIIDTTGFKVFRSRRIINRGHGEEDMGQYDNVPAFVESDSISARAQSVNGIKDSGQIGEEIFSYEGACGFFRRVALEDVRVDGQILDEDFWWYADDIDLGWRMRLLGWKSLYIPAMLAWHDRQTTKRLRKSIFDFIKLRRELSARKRALDYHNIHLTLVKNDFCGNILRDIIPFMGRELALFVYTLIFEPRTVLGWFSFFTRLPIMLRKRRLIMSRKKVSAKEVGKWFQ